MSSGTYEDVVEALPDHDVGRELGRGQFGIVYAARHRQLHRDVAIKQLVGEPDEATLTRFRREARILAQLDHPHVVRVFDYREHGPVRLLILEQLTGGSLADRMRGELAVEDAVAATLAAATGLHHVHEHGILHRDVKPENLMVNHAGLLRVTDFGIARGDTAEVTAADLTQTGSFFGTPAYAAPEQVAEAMAPGWPPVGPATDQWALAAVLYRALSGRPTHDPVDGIIGLFTRRLGEDARPLTDVAPTVPPQVAAVVMRALSRHPDARYPTTEAFAVDLGAAMRTAAGPGWLDRSGLGIAAVGPVLAAATGDDPVAPTPPPALAAATAAPTATATDDDDEPVVTAPPPVPAGAAAGSGRVPTGARWGGRTTRSVAAAAGVATIAAIAAVAAVVTSRPPPAGDVAVTAGSSTTTVPADPAELVWRFPTGDSIRANPLVADGMLVVGSLDHSIYGIDAATGVERWRVRTGGAVRSSAVGAGDTAYVGSDDGHLRALATADGTERWRAQVGFTLAGSPAVAGDAVVIGADQLYAYDRADGSLRWTFSTGGSPEDSIASTPATDGTTVYVGSDNGRLYAVDVASGAERWNLDTGGEVQSSPVVDAGVVYVGSNSGDLLAVDAADGTVRWRHRAGSPVRSSPAVSAQLVFVGTGAGRLLAVDRAEGTERWSAAAADKVDGSPALISDDVAVGTNDGTLLVVDQAAGEPRAWYRTGGPILARPAVAGPLVVVASYDGVVVALGGLETDSS